MDDDDLLDSHPDLMDPEWRKHARTDAWLGAKKDRKQLRKQRKRGARKPHRRWWILGVLVAILAVTTTAIVLVGRRPAQNAAPNPTRVPQYARVDLARPYANTPADTWPKGLDGITAPAAAAIGDFKADAVADAYAKVRQVIAVARLDPAVLTTRRPTWPCSPWTPARPSAATSGGSRRRTARRTCRPTSPRSPTATTCSTRGRGRSAASPREQGNGPVN